MYFSIKQKAKKGLLFPIFMLTNHPKYANIFVVGKIHIKNVRLAQLDRAFDYGSKGRGFESSNARMKKHLLPNRCFFYALTSAGSLSGAKKPLQIFLKVL